MVPCTLCSSVINEDDQYYLFVNMGPDIISTIETDFGREMDENGIMCATCFANILQKMTVVTSADTMTYHTELISSPHEEYELQHAHDRIVCVWCQSSLYMRRAHSLPEGPERHLISERISPRHILDGSLVCYTCWVRARSILQEDEVVHEESASAAIPNTCVWCLRSLDRRRRHSIPEGPERNEIIARMYPREIPPGGLVCYACWVSARRNVQRAANIAERTEDQDIAHNRRNVACASCGMSLFRRQTHSLPSGPERDEVAARVYPQELSGHDLVCTTCWMQITENVQVQQENEQVPQPVVATMELDQFTHTTSSSRNCFVPLCTVGDSYYLTHPKNKRV